MGAEQTAEHGGSEASSLAMAAAAAPQSPKEKSNQEFSDQKALVPIEKEPVLNAEKAAAVPHGNEKKKKMDSMDRDAALARVELEKKWALIKAWEESEKTKADNKAAKKLFALEAWENTRKALVEAELKQIQEEFEKKKAKWAEKIKNKIAEIHRAAEERRAMVEATRAEEILKVDEAAAKYRSTGNIPKRLFGCFS